VRRTPSHPTVLVVEILLDVMNPGVWMSHCRIAQQHERGMMFSFTIDP
jgi:FtsP/CotA-like multicopper oxidase with cupredoxin domain